MLGHRILIGHHGSEACEKSVSGQLNIADVNGIHVYDVNILETRQRQVCQDLAAQATSADHKNLAFISQKILYLLIA